MGSVTAEWQVLTLLLEERPPDMENSCEYTEQIVVGRRPVVILYLGDWKSCQRFISVKSYDVTKHFTRPRTWTDFGTIWLKIGTGGRACECGNKFHIHTVYLDIISVYLFTN